MFIRYIAVAASLMSSSLFGEFKFEEYIASNTTDYIKELSAEFLPSSEAEYKKAQKDLAADLKAKKWAKGLHAVKIILTYHHKDPEVLINVAIFCHQAYQEIKRSNYEYSRIVQCATFLAYKHAKNELQKAQALLLYSKDNYAPNSIEEANKLYPLEKLRKEDQRFTHINEFRYTNHSLEESPQGAILHLNFSHNLDIESPENYLEISPNVDGFIQASGSTIKASGFKSGVEYKVKLRSGIKSIFAETIEENNNVSFFVNDLKPLISFSSSAYIYPQQESIHLPVRAINIDVAKATLYRIPDRNIVNHLSHLMNRAYNIDSSEKLFSTTIDFGADT